MIWSIFFKQPNVRANLRTTRLILQKEQMIIKRKGPKEKSEVVSS